MGAPDGGPPIRGTRAGHRSRENPRSRGHRALGLPLHSRHGARAGPPSRRADGLSGRRPRRAPSDARRCRALLAW